MAKVEERCLIFVYENPKMDPKPTGFYLCANAFPNVFAPNAFECIYKFVLIQIDFTIAFRSIKRPHQFVNEFLSYIYTTSNT